MSMDLWLSADLGGVEREALDWDDPGNITYNVDPMFALALDGDPSAGIQNGAELLDRKSPALQRFKGKQAKECVVALRAAVERMEATPNAFRELNPPNGWGNYELAVAYLRRFLAACERAPEAYVEASF